MTAATVTIQVKNDLIELERVGRLVEAFGQAHHLPRRLIFELNLALDEILTNIVSYGYRDTSEHEIVVRLLLASDPFREVIVEVEDDAQPFDPTTAAVPDLELPVDARPVGGLGIHLVRKLMDRLVYSRQAGRNMLSMRKALDERRET
jgi:anti-sigma regulatory factor (Ser/Thr protein kinase)